MRAPSPVERPPKLPWSAELPSLAIAPVLDGRSALSRREVGPRLRFAFFGLVREGERQTGDASFGEAPLEAARRAAVAALARSAAFREVREAPSFGPGVAPLLEVELLEWVGSGRERTELNLLRLGFLRRWAAPATGRARLRARLRAPDRSLLFEALVERRLTLDSRDVQRAAEDALASAYEELGVRLWEHLGRRGATPLRRIPVRVLDGCGLGRNGVHALLEDASAIYHRSAGLRFDPLVESWTPGCASAGGLSCLAAARGHAPPANGFVLALAPADRTALERMRGARQGLAVQLGEHVWLACAPGEPIALSTVAHEIAHLFGAVHSDKRGSIMHPTASFEGRYFDPHNGEILALMRERPFGRALPGELVRGLETLYARGRTVGSAGETAFRDQR
jgi:hypothetical protein